MATFFEGVDKALTNLSQSPVGMAGLGLLMMPSQSLTPINPWQYAAEGMQMGVQNRQVAQKLKAQEDERARQEAIAQQLLPLLAKDFGGLEAVQGMTPEDITRMVEIRQAIIQDQEATIKKTREEAERILREDATRQYREKLDPSQRLAFDALPLDEKAKVISAQRFPSPQQLTNTEKVLLAAGLKPGTKEYQDAAMEALMRPKVQVNTGGDGGIPLGKVPSGYMINPEDPSRIVRIPGAPAVAPVMTNEEKLAYEAKKASSQLSSKQAFAQQQAATAVQRLGSALSRFSGMSALTPTDRAEYSSILDAAANAIAKARGTPGAEPPAPAIDRARASLPSIEELLTAPVLGNTAEAKMRALLEEFGGGAKMTTPGGAQVTTDMKNGGWTTLPNGVRVRRKQ